MTGNHKEVTNEKNDQGPTPQALASNSGSNNNGDKNNTHYHYENGKCFYKDPESNRKLEWNEDKQVWLEAISTVTPDADYILEGDTYVYTDPKEGMKYKWDKGKNVWVKHSAEDIVEEKKEEDTDDESEEECEDEEGNILKKEIKRQDMSKGHYTFENDTHIYTDDTDGTVYEWNKEKNAWFPKVDEDFLARYQLSYGFTASNENENTPEDPKREIKNMEKNEETLKRKVPQQPSWFDVEPENNTKVYVSNLPLDINEQEFVDLMQKCGLVMKDMDTGKMKVKLYSEYGTDILKGDALCTYIKVESVELALRILDGYDVRGKKIKVERAKFKMKGDSYDPSLKPKKRKRKEKEKMKKMQQKLFDWHPEKLRGQRNKSDRVVIIKNLFDPSIFDKDVSLILEYQQDLREESSKCGDVKKVIIFDRHPEGVAQINFKEAEAADACVQLLNNRWFGKRQITAETWDGKTKYKIAETDAEIKERLSKWDSFLESEKPKHSSVKTETERESDNDTRSSGGSDYDTEEEETK